MKKIVKYVIILGFLTAFGLVLFIKFDTAKAAELTDNYLRPLLGANTVIYLEKTFYNISDTVQKITYKQNSGSEFQFTESGTDSNSKSMDSDLSVENIPVKFGFTPEKNEGIWKNRALNIFPNQEVMAYTYVRPDPDRQYAYVTVVQIDSKAVHLSAVAGIKQPAGPVGKPGPGVVPQDIIDSGNLIAAFDGGFQYRDGQYGMIVDQTTYLPLQTDLGTIVGYTDGKIKIIDYQNQDLGKDVEFVRQNCPILIQNGQVSVLGEKNKKLWGRTLTSGIFTWRSGIGLNKNGNIIYAVGNNLTPLSLANALQMAGAVDAIQLDINPYWVRFNIFDKNKDDGGYKVSTLTKDIHDGSKEYLNGYSKDFFYVYKK